MKKLLSLIIVFGLALSLTACGQSAGASETTTASASETAASLAEAASETATEATSETATEAATEVTTAGEETSAEKTTIRLGALKGPTSMGLVQLLSENDAGEAANNYEFTLAGAADELTPKLIKGDMDIIIAPINLGSVLYNKTQGAVQMAAITTLGVTYIVEKGGETVNSLADLKGRTLYATGKGSIPEYTLRHLLEQSGLDPDKDLTIEWKSEPTEVVGLMSTEENSVAMLPQPYVTAAAAQLSDLRVAVNLTELWQDFHDDGLLITAGVIVRKEFAESNPEALRRFLEELGESVEYVNDNTAEAGTLIENYGIAKAAVATKALPQCNIVCITGADFTATASEFLKVLFGIAPEALGGALPEGDFYFE